MVVFSTRVAPNSPGHILVVAVHTIRSCWHYEKNKNHYQLHIKPHCIIFSGCRSNVVSSGGAYLQPSRSSRGANPASLSYRFSTFTNPALSKLVIFNVWPWYEKNVSLAIPRSSHRLNSQPHFVGTRQVTGREADSPFHS